MTQLDSENPNNSFAPRTISGRFFRVNIKINGRSESAFNIMLDSMRSREVPENLKDQITGVLEMPAPRLSGKGRIKFWFTEDGFNQFFLDSQDAILEAASILHNTSNVEYQIIEASKLSRVIFKDQFQAAQLISGKMIKEVDPIMELMAGRMTLEAFNNDAERTSRRKRTEEISSDELSLLLNDVRFDETEEERGI